MPQRGDASSQNNGKERKDQTENSCRGGVGGVQTESCGTLEKKLELGAGPAQNREISDIKSCDRKGRFVKGPVVECK